MDQIRPLHQFHPSFTQKFSEKIPRSASATWWSRPSSTPQYHRLPRRVAHSWRAVADGVNFIRLHVQERKWCVAATSLGKGLKARGRQGRHKKGRPSAALLFEADRSALPPSPRCRHDAFVSAGAWRSCATHRRGKRPSSARLQGARLTVCFQTKGRPRVALFYGAFPSARFAPSPSDVAAQQHHFPALHVVTLDEVNAHLHRRA